MGRRLLAEFVGTFWLVFGGCGSAILAAKFFDPQNNNVNYGIGLVGVSFAFGLTVLTMAFALGHVSGCHLNPAVTLGLVAGGRFKAADAPGYIIVQVLGALAAAGVLYLIATGKPGFSAVESGFASNGYGDHSPDKYTMAAGFIMEAVLTGMFLLIIMGATDPRAPVGLAPIAIGLGLTLINLIGIPVTNLSVNPARSTGPAVFVGGWAIEQLWLFWVAPIIGGIVGAIVYRIIAGDRRTVI